MLKSLLITDNIPKLVEYFVADRQIDHSLILILEGSYYRFDNGFNVVGTLGLDSNDVNMGIYKYIWTLILLGYLLLAQI